jgi:hypothetical protein
MTSPEMTLADAELKASEFLMGMCSPEQIIRWAAETVGPKNSSPVLVELASATEARQIDVRDVLARLVVALGGAPVDEKRAAITVSQETARRILDRTLDPYEGARFLWWTVARRVPTIEPLLRAFAGLASEWEDNPSVRSENEDAIRDAARALLDELST